VYVGLPVACHVYKTTDVARSNLCLQVSQCRVGGCINAGNANLLPGDVSHSAEEQTIADPWLSPIPVTIPNGPDTGESPSVATAALASGFVSHSGNQFYLNGKPFYPVGFNAYWMGFNEDLVVPPTYQVDEMFTAALNMKANVIRSHTVGFSSGSPNSLRPSSNKLNPAAWKGIDYALYKAGQTGIKIIPVMTDAYDYSHGNYGDFCKTRGVPKTSFFTNLDVRKDFKEYIGLWLNHTNSFTGIKNKDDPSIFAIELGNELGNYRPDATSTAVPTYDWLKDVSSYIKSIDKNHLVLDPADEALGKANDFQVSSLDMYSAHFYWPDYSRMDGNANSANNVGKPFFIGEYDSNFDDSWFKNVEARKGKVKGSLFWSMYPHYNGKPTGGRVPHDDGYTVWYDSAAKGQLLRLSNHFRRMQGLPTVTSLPGI
jgi:Cellulase (glycosyl hydrolase family 5)